MVIGESELVVVGCPGLECSLIAFKTFFTTPSVVRYI